MTNPNITIGSDKQIAYAYDIFAKKGDFIREQRAKFASQFAGLVADLNQHIGDTIPNTDRVVTKDMIADFSGGAEQYAVYWIEYEPSSEKLQAYVMTGAVSEKMARMGFGV